MYEDLDLSHLPLDVQDQVYSLVREFWSVFDGKGYTMPVLWRITSVLLIIDTGRFAPLWQRKSCTAIMRLLLCRCALPNCIKLVIHDSFTMTSGCSRPCLPQNLIRNTSVILRILSGTFGITYPISRCDTDVHSNFGCGPDGFIWLYDTRHTSRLSSITCQAITRLSGTRRNE